MFKFSSGDKTKGENQTQEEFVREVLAEQGVENADTVDFKYIKVKNKEEGMKLVEALEKKFKAWEAKTKK